MDFIGEEAFRFPFPGKVRLGSVQVLFFHSEWNPYLSEKAVGFSLFSLFPDRGIAYLTCGKVRLGSNRRRGCWIFAIPRQRYSLSSGSFRQRGCWISVSGGYRISHLCLGEEAIGFFVVFPD